MKYRLLRLGILVFMLGGSLLFYQLRTGIRGTTQEPSLLRWVPASVDRVTYTNWVRIKELKNATDLSSQSAWQKRRAFFLSVFETYSYSLLSFYGASSLEQHAQMWGWDPTDLVWELALPFKPHWAYVLKFRAGFDFARVQQRFEEHGFVRSEQQNVAIYSHTAAEGADPAWPRFADPALMNAAVVEHANLIMLAPTAEQLQEMLAVLDDPALALENDQALQAVRQRLLNATTAVLYPRSEACTIVVPSPQHDMTATHQRVVDDFNKQLAAAGPLRSYDAFGFGYQFKDERPEIIVAFHFPTAADADVAPRRHLATEGVGLLTRQRFDAYAFTVESASADGTMLEMTLLPVNDRLGEFSDLRSTRGLIFAACPQAR